MVVSAACVAIYGPFVADAYLLSTKRLGHEAGETSEGALCVCYFVAAGRGAFLGDVVCVLAVVVGPYRVHRRVAELLLGAGMDRCCVQCPLYCGG